MLNGHKSFFIGLFLFPFFQSNLLAQSNASAVFDGIIYSPDVTYSAGSAVILSSSDTEVYTAKESVKGISPPNSDYWQTSAETASELQESESFKSALGDLENILNDPEFNASKLASAVGDLTTPTTSTQNAKIVRLSVRGHIGTADDERFMAFSVLGSTEVLVRAIGPTLGDLDSGLAPYSLLDPSLVLINSADDKDMDGFGNDDYSTSSNANQISQLSQTIYPPIPIKSTESASINTFSTGTYYANVRDKQFSSSFGSRIGWVAVDMTDSSASGGFTGVSCRGIVKPADGAMFAAFEIVGDASEKRKIFIRGRGASLASFGVSSTLSNIMLSLYQFDTVGDTTTFLQDNKTYTSQSNSAEIKQNSIDYFPELKISLDDSDPGMIVELSPGYYTVDIESEDGNSGNAWLGVDDITE